MTINKLDILYTPILVRRLIPLLHEIGDRDQAFETYYSVEPGRRKIILTIKTRRFVQNRERK